MITIFIQLAVLLICILIGARMSGIGLGVMGITASPVLAASATFLTVLAMNGLKLADILMVCIPATLIGVLVGILFVFKRGKELSKDPEFLEKMKDTVCAKNLDSGQHEEKIILKPGAIKSVIIFAIALFAMSILLFSQAATTKALMPLGLSPGMAPANLVGIFPAVTGLILQSFLL